MTLKENNNKILSANREISSAENAISNATNKITQIEKELEKNELKVCHTCGHDLEDNKHQELLTSLVAKKEEYVNVVNKNSELIREVSESTQEITLCDLPSTFYGTLADAYNHKSSISSLTAQLDSEQNAINPYLETIENLEKNAIQDIDYTKIDEIKILKDHQEFLLKLLVNKDSFIRKKIINQNLSYLNKRLDFYLKKIGLPHSVVFESDLNVAIQEHGRDLDFDNLSRGERTRLILSLSWSFRDVYESLNSKINLLFIDELIDNGLDINGVESALSVLKHMVRDDNRCIFLISHRDELMGRVDNVLRVVKEGGFTSFSIEEI